MANVYGNHPDVLELLTRLGLVDGRTFQAELALGPDGLVTITTKRNAGPELLDLLADLRRSGVSRETPCAQPTSNHDEHLADTERARDESDGMLVAAQTANQRLRDELNAARATIRQYAAEWGNLRSFLSQYRDGDAVPVGAIHDILKRGPAEDVILVGYRVCDTIDLDGRCQSQ